ncbi:MAG: BrnA antitoxin family protein [Bryobacteraceae bacterium]|nr:BrnA antitoxin family protein [Bryobacteraceae bacterium]
MKTQFRTRSDAALLKPPKSEHGKTAKKQEIPKFASEAEEAKWWASKAGRAFLKGQSRLHDGITAGGSPLVEKLKRARSVQIALRLPATDLARARELAGQKGIGYQTLLKMIVHEGLQQTRRKN